MKQVFAFVMVAIGFSVLGASVYHAVTTPWNASDAQVADAFAQSFTAPAEPEARLYAPQITADMVRRAKKVVLHLDGIHATTEVDSVVVRLLTTISVVHDVTKINRQEVQADVARLKLGFSGNPKDKSISFDVTAEFSAIKDAEPSNFLVAYMVKGPNQREPMDMYAFNVDQTYFTLFDANGKPVTP